MAELIVTIPPYAPFIEEVASQKVVSGLRLNTVMPTKGRLEDVLQGIKDKAQEKDVWIDLKARQLRVEGYWTPPFTELKVSHPISVQTPCRVYFNDGLDYSTLLEVDGQRLIMQDGPRRVVGPGESLNILEASLEINGFLTDTDKAYIAAAENVGLNNYMLSFVESESDIDAFHSLVPDATVVAKIESRKGMQYVHAEWPEHKKSRLMAASGDLYVELQRPHYIVQAVESIVKQDPKAIVASRIFPSLSHGLHPSCSDISDVDNLLRMGYRSFMLGDEVCLQRDSVLSAINLFESIARRYN